MPVRGDAPFLFHAIKSLSESTLIPSEVLIIDDGISPEQLIWISNLHTNFTVNVIKNRGEGIVNALNTGLNMAQNELVARLDSDDMAYKDRLKTQYDFLNGSPDVLVVGSQVTFIDPDNEIVGRSNYPIGSINNNAGFNSSCLIAHPSVMYRKSTIIEIGGYREVVKVGNVSLCEDFDLWKRIGKNGKLVNMDSELTFYRQHSGQVSERFNYAAELGTLFVASDGFDKSNTKLEITLNGNINFESEVKDAISDLSKLKTYKFFIYTKLIRDDLHCKKGISILGACCIKVINFFIKLSSTITKSF